MFALPAAAEPLVASFRCAFTRPSFDRFVLLSVGMIVTYGRRTVSRILWTIRGVAHGHYSSYHRLFSRARWSLWPLGKVLTSAVLQWVDANEPVLLAVDDTVAGHCGQKVYGKGCHRDSVRSTRNQAVKKWGHKWIVVTVLVRLPFTERRWALPILVALYRVPVVSAEQKRRHKTPCQLTRGLLSALLRWFPDRKFILMGDAGFCSHDLAWFCRRYRQRITLIVRGHPDACLYAMPRPLHKKSVLRLKRWDRLGIPYRRHSCRKGTKLPSPAQTVAKARAHGPLPQMQLQWYGQSRRNLGIFSAAGGWYRRRGSNTAALIPIRWVCVHDNPGNHDDWFFSTDPAMSPGPIVEYFACRWSIEVMFQEVRGHLGLETTRQRCEKSVLRTAPCIFGLFSVISMLFAQQWQRARHLQIKRLHQTPCYRKTEPTFADALYAVRRMLWDQNLLAQLLGKQRTSRFPPAVRETLITYLSQAA